MRVLVVKSPFGDHKRGSVIRDPKLIDKILAGEQQLHVVQSEHPEERVEITAPQAAPVLDEPEHTEQE